MQHDEYMDLLYARERELREAHKLIEEIIKGVERAQKAYGTTKVEEAVQAWSAESSQEEQSA